MEEQGCWKEVMYILNTATATVYGVRNIHIKEIMVECTALSS